MQSSSCMAAFAQWGNRVESKCPKKNAREEPSLSADAAQTFQTTLPWHAKSPSHIQDGRTSHSSHIIFLERLLFSTFSSTLNLPLQNPFLLVTLLGQVFDAISLASSMMLGLFFPHIIFLSCIFLLLQFLTHLPQPHNHPTRFNTSLTSFSLMVLNPKDLTWLPFLNLATPAVTFHASL